MNSADVSRVCRGIVCGMHRFPVPLCCRRRRRPLLSWVGLCACALVVVVLPLQLVLWRLHSVHQAFARDSSEPDLRVRDVAYLHSEERRCTLTDPACFDLDRCSGLAANAGAAHAPPDGLLPLLPVYIYGENEGWEGMLWWLRHVGGYARHLRASRMRFVARIHDALLADGGAAAGVRVVRNPQEACVFVPLISCLEVNKCDVWEGWSLWRLRSLPHWHGGRNHVLFDLSDDPSSKFDGDRAIRARSSFSTRFYRPRFDVAMPLYPRWVLAKDAASWPPRRRPLLASFRGTATDPHGLRAALVALHSHVRVRVQGEEGFAVGGGDGLPAGRVPAGRVPAGKVPAGTEGRGGTRSAAAPPRTYPPTDCVVILRSMDHKIRDQRYFSSAGWRQDDQSYASLLLRSVFALVPRGSGLHSHRLLESLAAGAIPVVLADALVLPFPDVIEWSALSLRFPETELLAPGGAQRLKAFLLAVSPARIEAMHQRVRRTYEEFFQGPRNFTAEVFRAIRRNIVNAQAATRPAAAPLRVAPRVLASAVGGAASLPRNDVGSDNASQ